MTNLNKDGLPSGRGLNQIRIILLTIKLGLSVNRPLTDRD
jgi:hypothetical protein